VKDQYLVTKFGMFGYVSYLPPFSATSLFTNGGSCM
jgi:hypothetical protein